MATIPATTNEKVVSIKAFLGLHESPDGDNKLKLGEATVCKNWKITENGNLKKRPGTVTKYTLGSAPVMGMWHGSVSEREIFVVACSGHLWMLMDDGAYLAQKVDLGAYDTSVDVGMIGFEEKLWILNGSQYVVLYWKPAETHIEDNEQVTTPAHWQLDDVVSGTYGYVPIVAITVPPDGGGVIFEQVNKLNGKRRVWISPDGESFTYQLPETGLQSIDYVKDLVHDTYLIAGQDYAAYPVPGQVTFLSDTAPGAVPNSYEIAYTFPSNYKDQIKKMRFAELYAGTQDSRMFIYGDGTNFAYYSGLDYDGNPRGDYFPDLNVVDVGDSNTPITGLIRHYSKMLAFKTNSCFSVDYGVVTLADSSLTPAFYSTPLNRQVGNEPLGQVQLIGNAPRTLCQGNLYEWRNGSAYSANISMDERQAKVISDRIYATLRKIDFSKAHCYDDNYHQEYYIIDKDGNALVHNYKADAWYYYTGVDARMVLEINGELYIGTKSGKILLLDETKYSDDGAPIMCEWASGVMDFGGSYMRKYSAQIWVAMKSEANNSANVTVQTDRSTENAEVSVDPEYENDIPKTKRCKVKVKKFVFYRLLFSSKSFDTTATIVDTEIKVRYTSQAK